MKKPETQGNSKDVKSSDNLVKVQRDSALRARRGVRKSISARHNLGGLGLCPSVRIRMQITLGDLNKKVPGSDNL